MDVRQRTEEIEHTTFAPGATFSDQSRGRMLPEEQDPIRPVFQRDRDRVLHCKAFRRLKQKTQVFLSPEGDLYRTRLTHTLEVSQIARTIARALRLNEDLTEAISLAHDLGHTPFGHAGERALNELCPDGFKHYMQSLRVVDKLEKDGRGLNLTWEVRNGIVTHTKGTWAATPEGRIVRMADQIAYVNHDIEDAVRAGVLDPATLPKECTAVLGQTKSARITTMINSILANSDGDVKVGAEENEAFLALRDFMYATVYVDKNHPLAGRGEVTEEELAPYPCVTFEQGTHNAVFFSEDISMPAVTPRHILVRDRATANDLTREINAYQPGIGLDDEVSRTVYASAMLLLKPRKRVSLGYIVRNHMLLSPMAQAYIQAMEEYAEKYKQSHLT